MFEYILLLAGILLIVVLAVVVLRGGIFQGANSNIKSQSCQAALARNSTCYYVNGTWDNHSLSYINTGNGVAGLPASCQDTDVLTNYMNPQTDMLSNISRAYHCGPKPA